MSKDKSKKKPKVEKPKGGLALSEDRYLLRKEMPASALKEVVDISDVDLNIPVNEKEVKLYAKQDDAVLFDDSDKPVGVYRTYCIQQLFTYTGVPKEGDIVCWYNDLGPLCGSAGYMLLRDGYVRSTYAVIRA